MLDPKFIRENPDVVKDACRKKRIDVDVDRLVALDGEMREIRRKLETLKAEQNARSKQMPSLSAEGKAALRAELKVLSDQVSEGQNALKALEPELEGLLLRVPNIPAPEVPDGKDDTENVELRKVGTPRVFEFTPKDHVELGTSLDLLDTERAAKIAGSRSYFLKNEGALLEL
ncbi:MAG: hypothetical protein RIS21_852, partial [Planctomycetota bacterium]